MATAIFSRIIGDKTLRKRTYRHKQEKHMRSLTEQFTTTDESFAENAPISMSPLAIHAVWASPKSEKGDTTLLEFSGDKCVEVKGKVEDIVRALDFPYLMVTDDENKLKGYVNTLSLVCFYPNHEAKKGSIIEYGMLKNTISESYESLVKQATDLGNLGGWLDTLTIQTQTSSRIERSTPVTN